MFNYYKILSSLFILICFSTTNIHATNTVNFHNIGVEDGLSQSTVEIIFQDSRGYIWIGTHDGLNRYNGNSFRIYKYSEDKNESLSGNFITEIIEDYDGYMWVGTTNGLNKIDIENDTITKYVGEQSGGTLSNSYISDILFVDGKIIISTTQGMDLYDKEKDEFIKLELDENMTSNRIYSMEVDHNENLWVATSNGLDKFSKDLELIKSFENGTETQIATKDVYNLQYDENGYMWVGTKEDGVIRIDLETNEKKFYVNDPSDKYSISNGLIGDIYIDNNDNLWIGTNSGLSKYNYEKDNFITYKNNPNDKNSLINNNVKDIYEDCEGLIWIGTYLGISIFDPNNKIIYYRGEEGYANSLSQKSVHGIYEDDEELLWVGTNSEGLNIIDRENDTIYYINEGNEELRLSDYSIKDITGYGNNIFVATKNGLNRIDKLYKTVEIITTEDGLSSNLINKVFLDSKGYLWVGTDNGINIIDTKDMSIVNDIGSLGNLSSFIYTIYEDSNGYYYLGLFRNEGLLKIDPITKEVVNFIYSDIDENSLSNSNVRSIVEDLNGDIWVGTSYGLNKIEDSKITRYTMKDGLCNDTVYGILVDDSNNLWMSTNGGISKFNTSELRFENFNIMDGLQSNEFNGNAYYKTKDFDLVFGGVNGLNIIDVEEMSTKEYRPSVIFEGVEVHGKESDDIFTRKLNYDENVLRIKYFLPKYSTNNVSYYYTLDNGYNSEWIETTNNDVVFHQLIPGEYTFRISPRYSNGDIGEESLITFEIRPPFWKTDMAYCIYFLIVLLIVHSMINKTKRLDKLVKSKTEKLVEEMDRNTELLNKVLKLEQNKNNYFVNLSHELRTPLNVISSTNQLIYGLNNSENGIPKEKLNHYIDIYQRNSSRLLNLINNIIDGSKIESNTYVLKIENKDLVLVVEDCVLGLVDYAKEKKINLIIDPKIEELYLDIDSYEIERCVVNLVSNAIKFTPENGTIEVNIDQDGNNALISVEDNGIGIDEKNQKIIFDRFSQVIDDNQVVKGGSGLGLTITKQIIKLHSGEINVYSEVNKGSKFVITLPIQK